MKIILFLKSYKSLKKLANLRDTPGAFETKAVGMVKMIDSYSGGLDEKKRDIFYNWFIVSQKQTHTLKELYRLLDIDKTEYDRLKSEILLDFARSYREGALFIYKDKN